MTIAEIERELRTAIEAQVAKGATPMVGRWGIEIVDGRFAFKDEKPCGCVLALWAMEHRAPAEGFSAGTAAVTAFSKRCDITAGEASAIALGFDGDANTHPSQFYDLGAKLAEEYVK